MTSEPRPTPESGGVYSNLEIVKERKLKHILIEPFVMANLSTTSYDVTLGEYYWPTDSATQSKVLNPFAPASIRQYFGTSAKKAKTHKQWLKEHPDIAPFENIPLNALIIVLDPGERILGHTQEFIGIDPPGTSVMHARSTTGRLGIQVCEDAGWGDSGYRNRWTMEIHNGNSNRMVPLVVGMRIAQIAFLKTGPVKGSYGERGSYQSASTDLKSLMKVWKPTMMLPHKLRPKG